MVKIESPAHVVANLLRHYLDEYFQMQEQGTQMKVRQPQTWKPPNNGLYKVNFDGALD